MTKKKTKSKSWTGSEYTTIKVGKAEWKRFKVICAANEFQTMQVVNWLLNKWSEKNKKALEEL